MTKHIQRGLLAVGVLAATGANAAVDAAVGTAITGAGADGLLYVSAFTVAAAGFILIKKVLSKLGLNF